MDGKAKPCCDSQKYFDDINLKRKSIEGAFNSEQYKKLRVDMLSGVENEHCKACYDLEKQNITSSRNKWNSHHTKHVDSVKSKYVNNKKFTGKVKTDFISLDLRPSNICNFKCRTCNDAFSTRWQDERTDFLKENYPVLSNGKEQVSGLNKIDFSLKEDSIENIEVLYFAGGEPFVLEEHFDLLNSLKYKNNISLHYNTNFSILKYKGKTIYEHLKDFRKVHFSISLDAQNDLGEFIRTGFKQSVFTKNLLELKKARALYQNVTYDFQYTCSLLNVFNFFDFVKELEEDDDLINFHFIHYPFWYNPIHFDDIKEQIIELYTSRIDEIKSERVRAEIEKYLQYLKMSNPSDWDKHNAVKYLKANTLHTLVFNNVDLPDELDFIRRIIYNENV